MPCRDSVESKQHAVGLNSERFCKRNIYRQYKNLHEQTNNQTNKRTNKQTNKQTNNQNTGVAKTTIVKYHSTLLEHNQYRRIDNQNWQKCRNRFWFLAGITLFWDVMSQSLVNCYRRCSAASYLHLLPYRWSQWLFQMLHKCTKLDTVTFHKTIILIFKTVRTSDVTLLSLMPYRTMRHV
jgi:hypothetical protein